MNKDNLIIIANLGSAFDFFFGGGGGVGVVFGSWKGVPNLMGL